MQVEQRHRDAVADAIVSRERSVALERLSSDIRHGKADNNKWVQAFARFEASLPPSAPVDRVEQGLPDIEAEAERIVAETYKPEKGDYLWTDVVGAVATAIDEERNRHPHRSVLAESTSNDCLLVAEGWQDIATLKDEDGYVLGWSPRSDEFREREYFMGCRYEIRANALINEISGRWRTVKFWRPLPAPPAVTDLSGVGVG